jgi:hypothetical protein
MLVHNGWVPNWVRKTVSTLDHAVGERRDFPRTHSPEKHRHREGGHLVVWHFAPGVAVDQVLDLNTR